MDRPGSFYHPVTSPIRPHSHVLVEASDDPGDPLVRPPLAPQEKALVGVTAFHLCFLPWALGTMHGWSQLASLGLSLLGFVLAALPRNHASPAAQLLRLPVWWAAVALLGYIVIQGLNPAWRFQSNADRWWLEPAAHLSWLPSGIEAPFDRANPWRALTVLGSLALLLASVWVGFTRRRSYHALLVVLAVNAVLLALFGLMQRIAGATKIFWSYYPGTDSFVASFIYPNHAGAYLNLMVAVTAGLAWWHHQRARRRLENPGRAPVFAASAALIAALVILSYSRMSIFLLLSFILLTGAGAVVRGVSRDDRVRRRQSFRTAGLACAVFLALVLAALQTEKIRLRFDEVFAHPDAAVRDRTLARQAATDMLKDYWLLGWGAGCFRYGFPKYTAGYPEIHYFDNGVRRSWEHAHDDLLEFPIELGIVGLLPVLTVLGRGLWQFARRRAWTNVLSLGLSQGCALALLHGWVDFVFQCPAVLLTWGVLSAGALRWTELDRSVRPSCGVS